MADMLERMWFLTAFGEMIYKVLKQIDTYESPRNCDFFKMFVISVTKV